MPGSEAQNLLNLDRVYPRRQTRVNVEHLPGAPHTGIRMPMLEGTETVLVVDDETFMLSLAQLMLMRHGYTVLTATSGQEVLHMLELWPDLKIDVAVIDVVMPVMDGFELVERLRKIRPRLSILYMSAYPEKAELRPEQTRNIPFVPKPFSSLTLVGKIREALDTPLS